jgi:hypothetical protein
MMGDRYGELLKVTQSRKRVWPEQPYAFSREIAHVKLDKSGKTIRVIFDDCEVVPC